MTPDTDSSEKIMKKALKFIVLIFKIAIKIAVPVLLIGGALMFAKSKIASKPPRKSNTPPVVIPQVEVTHLSKGEYAPNIKTFGTVQSQYETVVTPQVSGQVTYVSDVFHVGQTLSKGAVLVKIDRTDYEAALAQARYNLSVAERTLAEEDVLSQQAAEEWVSSGRLLKDARDFVLRKPQLNAAKLNVQAKKAAVTKAEKDLERTELRAPFDAVVLSRSVSLGEMAVPQSGLGTLLSTEAVEVRLPLTSSQRKRMLKFAHKGEPLQLPIQLNSPNFPDIKWDAVLTREAPVIDSSNQTFYVIAEVLDPYKKKGTPLSIGTFVNAEIPSQTIKNCFKVLESAIVNNAFIWVVVEAEEEDVLVLKKEAIVRHHTEGAFAYISLSATQETTELMIVKRPLINFSSGDEVVCKSSAQQKQ